MFAAADVRAGILYLTSCSGYGDNGNDTDLAGGLVWQAYGSGAYGFVNRCPQGGSFQILSDYRPGYGQTAQWITTAPPSIQIVQALTPVNDVLIDPHINADGYAAHFFWDSGAQNIWPVNNCCGGMYYGAGINRGFAPSRHFGFQVTCNASPCNAPFGQLLDVRGIQLEGVDYSYPMLHAIGYNNLFYQGGSWVRGTWPASFTASADSGICATHALVAGKWVPGPTDWTPNQHSWTQCPWATTMNLSVDTTNYPNGSSSLTFSAADATWPPNEVSPSATLHVDNQPVALNLTGPSDAPSTAGTQYVNATATAGPSGVARIVCSTDGSPYQVHVGASAAIPVHGLGEHKVDCYAQNNSIDSYGNAARSPAESWNLSIRQPSVSTLSFARVVDALRCAKKRERVHIPARWVTAQYHGHKVRIKLPAETRTVTVIRCHPRIVRRKVRVDGRWRFQRVVLLPHAVRDTTKRIAHGRGATVSGWLGTESGIALGNQRVLIMTAPDDGREDFTQAAATTTAANGSWSARLPPGPSRLVEAVFNGTATVEPATSPAARVVVPASVGIAIHPHVTHWGGTITIRGLLRGGYVPPAGELVVLRIGWPGGSTEIGHLYADRRGRFQSRYTFLRGNGTERYVLRAATAKESDYPYAPARSRGSAVTVRP
jgi:hypothetical protein